MKVDIDGYELERIDKAINIYKDGEIIDVIHLIPEDVTIAKINVSLSNVCTMHCLYCSEADYNNDIQVNNLEIINQVFDLYFRWLKQYDSIKTIKLSFDYGGEPVCQFDLMKQVIELFRTFCYDNGKKSTVLMTTNGVWEPSIVNDLVYMIDEIIFSIDGPKEIHDKYRIYKGNESNYDLILNNAIAIKNAGKLKQISTVVTRDLIDNVKVYGDFLLKNFKGCTVRINSVIILGDAYNNSIERITVDEWNGFITQLNRIISNDLFIIETKISKRLDLQFDYGCTHMMTHNWFCWVDGTVSCCTERNNLDFKIGQVVDNKFILDYKKMLQLKTQNFIENINDCNDCLAKYYCAGSCPKFRNQKVNCARRIDKYGKLLISSTK